MMLESGKRHYCSSGSAVAWKELEMGTRIIIDRAMFFELCF